MTGDFVRDTLMDVGLPDKMIQIIMTCITSASKRLLWNGVETDDFRPSRGIRQGDPISPYIFVLCMERLAHRIRLETEKGVWKPIRLTRGDTMLTHLFFADDVVLFGEASLEQIEVIKDCLQDFCHSSGQKKKVSLKKSRIHLSSNLSHQHSQAISRLEFFSLMILGNF